MPSVGQETEVRDLWVTRFPVDTPATDIAPNIPSFQMPEEDATEYRCCTLTNPFIDLLGPHVPAPQTMTAWPDLLP